MYKFFGMLINTEYEILDSSGKFVDFLGVEKKEKKDGLKITLENNKYIIVSNDHIFIVGNKNIRANLLVPNLSYLSTINGDLFVKSIERVSETEFYDIVDSKNVDYYANDILNHNCSFLGSGDNFIAEDYLKRIEENEIKVPIRQEYNDKNMWIFEDPIPGEEYIVAVDASPGHGEDSSTINILKRNEFVEEQIIKKNGRTKKTKVKGFKVEQVAEYYGKIAPQLLAEITYIYAKSYNDGYVVVDITGGYGIQTVNKLLEIGYDNIHYAEVNHKPSRDMLAGYVKQGNKIMSDGKTMLVDLIPGFFIGNNRSSVLLELQRSIHLGDVIIRSVRLLNELKTFITVPGNRVADHKRSFHDDSIMGLAIGLFVINYDMAKFKESDSLKSVMMKSFLNINKENKEKFKEKKPSIEQRNNPYGANAWLFSGMKM